MQLEYIKPTVAFVERLKISDKARVDRVRELFEEFGFSIGPKYVKKVSALGIWELRAGDVRLLLSIRGKNAICVHAFYKKTQRLSKADLKLAEMRSEQL